MGRVHNSTNSVNPFIIGGKQPLDVRTVLQTSEDLKDRAIMSSAYKGMVVYIVDDDSLYVCHTESNRKLTNIEDGWRKIDNDYSVRIVESVSNLTDETILFPYEGMMVYVESDSSLYLLTTKGNRNSKDPKNWKKISTSSLDKVGIDVAPEGGSGFKITKSIDVEIEEYISVEKCIKKDYLYTSRGVNSYKEDLNFKWDSLKLSKENTNSYIELYNGGEEWIYISDEDDSLNLKHLHDTSAKKESKICFGVDINFTDDWMISYGSGDEYVYRNFKDDDYDLIDIYRCECSPEVYAYLNDIDVKVLTEIDFDKIVDMIDNMAHSIMIELGDSDGGSDSEDEDENENTPVPLQKVIVNMNNAITKLEQTTVEPETIDDSEIDILFHE